MNIRIASVKDIVALSELFDQYRIFYRKKSDLNKAQEFLKDRISNQESIIYVAESDDGVLVGFVQLYPIFSSTRMKKLWLLNDLFVSVNFRGKKISVQLIDKAKELARNTNACGLLLETEKTNEIGNTLYPRTGFGHNDGSNFYSWDV